MSSVVKLLVHALAGQSFTFNHCIFSFPAKPMQNVNTETGMEKAYKIALAKVQV